jgi:hypothetical protein
VENCGISDIRYVQVIKRVPLKHEVEDPRYKEKGPPPRYLFKYFHVDKDGRIMGLDREWDHSLGMSGDGIAASGYQYLCFKCLHDYVYWQDVQLHVSKDENPTL